MGKHLITHLESRDTDKKFPVESVKGGSATKDRSEVRKRDYFFLKTSDKTTQCLLGPETRVTTKGRKLAEPCRRALSRLLSRVLISLLLVTSMVIVTGVPMPEIGKVSNYDQTFEMVHADRLGFEDEDNDVFVPTSGKGRLDERELETIRSSIVEGLGLERIPDPSKANISQAEYVRAHRDYLSRIHTNHGHGHERRKRLFTIQPAEHPGNGSCANSLLDDRPFESLTFHMTILDRAHSTVEHSTLRFLLGSEIQIGTLSILIYEPLLSSSRRLISRKRLNLHEPEAPRWVEFDLTEVVSSWLEDGETDLCLQLQFVQKGIPIRRSFFSPALNVFTHHDPSRTRSKRGAHDQLMSLHKGRRTECRGDSKKCCRHQMTVIFKDLKGFEFIIQPKTFDAGYCKGRCPPRYNPAHHHALLQSLIWKEDRRKAPRPCCAPSKLAELEILYFDENDPSKLKVSNWKNMKVLECACS